MIQTVEGEMLSESNLLQTLQQHGLALSADDLHTLRNFIKPSDVGDSQHQFINQQVICLFVVLISNLATAWASSMSWTRQLCK